MVGGRWMTLFLGVISRLFRHCRDDMTSLLHGIDAMLRELTSLMTTPARAIVEDEVTM